MDDVSDLHGLDEDDPIEGDGDALGGAVPSTGDPGDDVDELEQFAGVGPALAVGLGRMERVRRAEGGVRDGTRGGDGRGGRGRGAVGGRGGTGEADEEEDGEGEGEEGGREDDQGGRHVVCIFLFWLFCTVFCGWIGRLRHTQRTSCVSSRLPVERTRCKPEAKDQGGVGNAARMSASAAT